MDGMMYIRRLCSTGDEGDGSESEREGEGVDG